MQGRKRLLLVLGAVTIATTAIGLVTQANDTSAQRTHDDAVAKCEHMTATEWCGIFEHEFSALCDDGVPACAEETSKRRKIVLCKAIRASRKSVLSKSRAKRLLELGTLDCEGELCPNALPHTDETFVMDTDVCESQQHGYKRRHSFLERVRQLLILQ